MDLATFDKLLALIFSLLVTYIAFVLTGGYYD